LCAGILYPKYKNLGFEVEALRHLQPLVIAEFNNEVTNHKGVKFSIAYTDKIPATCDSSESGGGVPVSSTIWKISDASLSDSLEHTALTGKEGFVRFIPSRFALEPKKAK
jgi:hypothetical protein